MRVVATILFLTPVTFSYAQSLRVPVSSSYQMVNAYSQNHADVFSFTHNTAALAKLEHHSIGIFGESRFLIPELGCYNLAAGMLTSQGNFGLQTSYFGNANFNEYQLGVAYARPLGDRLDIGAQFNYYSYRIPTYKPASALTFQIGAIARLSQVVNVGLQVHNPVGGYLSKKAGEKLSSSYAFGIGYEPTEQIVVSATLVKEEAQDVSVTAGIFYHFDKQFFARAGIRTDMNMPFGAAGIYFDELRLDVSVSHHPQLGFSPGVMIIYQPKK